MPKVFEWNGFRFHFYSEECDPREEPHNHIRKGRDNAKFWLRPEVALAYNRGFPPQVLTRLAEVVEQRRDLIESAWHDHFDLSASHFARAAGRPLRRIQLLGRS